MASPEESAAARREAQGGGGGVWPPRGGEASKQSGRQEGPISAVGRREKEAEPRSRSGREFLVSLTSQQKTMRQVFLAYIIFV